MLSTQVLFFCNCNMNTCTQCLFIFVYCQFIKISRKTKCEMMAHFIISCKTWCRYSLFLHFVSGFFVVVVIQHFHEEKSDNSNEKPHGYEWMILHNSNNSIIRKRVNMQLIKCYINTNMSNHRIPVFLTSNFRLVRAPCHNFSKHIKRENQKSIKNKNSVHILRGKLYQQTVLFWFYEIFALKNTETSSFVPFEFATVFLNLSKA